MSTSDQPNPPTADTKPVGISWFIWTILLLPILYFLSIGPIARAYPANPPQAVRTFYQPPTSLVNNSEPLHHLYIWYIGISVPIPPFLPPPPPTTNEPPTSNTSTN